MSEAVEYRDEAGGVADKSSRMRSTISANARKGKEREASLVLEKFTALSPM